MKFTNTAVLFIATMAINISAFPPPYSTNVSVINGNNASVVNSNTLTNSTTAANRNETTSGPGTEERAL